MVVDSCYFVVPAERVVVNKERLAGYYRLSSYFLAKTASETLLVLFHPLLTTTISYWISGVNYDFLVYLQVLSLNMCASAMGHVSSIFSV